MVINPKHQLSEDLLFLIQIPSPLPQTWERLGPSEDLLTLACLHVQQI